MLTTTFKEYRFFSLVFIMSSMLVALFFFTHNSAYANHCPQNPTDPICVCEDGGGVWQLSGGGSCTYPNGGGGGSTGPTQPGGSTGPVISLLNPLKATSISAFLLGVIDVLLVFALPIIIIFIMYAGFLFVTARGNEGQITTAKAALTWAVIGGVILLGAKLIITLIQGTVSSFGP